MAFTLVIPPRHARRQPPPGVDQRLRRHERKVSAMKTLIATATLAIAASIAAASPAAAQEAFEGPYAGIEAGWTQNKIGRAETEIGRADVRTSQDSATAGIFAGYNKKVSD